METTAVRKALKELVERPDREVDLAYAALLLVKEDYPTMSVSSYLRQLDRWGALARANMGQSRNPHVMIDRLNHTLFNETGFRGDVETYHDPRNSFLNEVMDRRTGIPITLSIVYMAVAQRANLPLVGVGLPGHFIVRYAGLGAGVPLYLDPFHQGALLTVTRCQALVKRTVAENVRWDPSWLNPVKKVEILSRLLRNLKRSYITMSQPLKALSVMERLLILEPRNEDEQQEYLNLHAQLN